MTFTDASSIKLFKTANVRNAIICCNNLDINEKLMPQIAKESANSAYGFVIDKLELEDYEKLLADDTRWFKVIRQTPLIESIVAQIQSDSEKFITKFDVSQGLIPYDKYRGHSTEMIKNKVFHADHKKNDTYKKFLKGDNVTQYDVEWDGKKWISYGNWIANPRKPKFFVEPRILVREISDIGLINAGYTEEELYNNPSIINIINKDKVTYDLRYILGILNSNVMAFYHVFNSPKAKKGLFPKILVGDIHKLPLKYSTIHESLIRSLVLNIEELITKIKMIDKIIDNPYNFSSNFNIKLTNLSNTDGIIKEITFNRTLGNVKEVRLEGQNLLISRNFKLGVPSRQIAVVLKNFIEFNLALIKGKTQSEVDKIIQIPCNLQECIKYDSSIKKVKESKNSLKTELVNRQNEINSLVYDLYGIDSIYKEEIEKQLSSRKKQE